MVIWWGTTTSAWPWRNAHFGALARVALAPIGWLGWHYSGALTDGVVRAVPTSGAVGSFRVNQQLTLHARRYRA